MVRAINLIEAISSHLSESFGNSNDNSNDQNNDSISNGLINNNNTNSYNNNNTINNINGLFQARTFFVGGNFKMNGNKNSIKAIIDNLNSADLPSNVEVVISPPSIYLALAADAITAPTVSVAAQNCFNKASGAYTGEISPESLKDINVPWVILGHSERRTIIKESDEFIADKTKFALDSGLKVILCIGETYEEKQAGETLNVCKRQLKAVSDVVKDWTNIVVAYEPVWAIGTGLAATAQDAQNIHKDIRDYLSTVIGEQAASVRILYGGSANGKNCTDFRDKPDVDGFLVGGASLKPEFVDIIKSRQ